jgi:hypothetical protein
MNEPGKNNSSRPAFDSGKVSPVRDGKANNDGNGNKVTVDDVVKGYVAGLSNEHHMLIVLKGQLYDGQWEPMLDDLKNRLAGKPYIFKLVNRINDDIKRIEQMMEFEKKYNIDLVDYVDS